MGENSVFDNLGGMFEDRTGMDVGGTSAGDRALNAQRDASHQANELQRYMYDTQRGDAAPWRDAGVRSLSQLASGDFQRDFTPSDFQADPGFAFRMAEGQKAIERSAAARGGLNSGATMKALMRFGQDTASSEYQNAYNRFNADRDRRFNRLSNLAGLGQTANSQVANASQNYAANVGNNMIGIGNAQAAMNINRANRMNQFMDRGEEMAARGAGAMFSDARLKTEVEPISPADIAELRAVIKPYRFQYIDTKYGDGTWIGVMAQDLNKSRLGRTLVHTDKHGHLKIDVNKAVSLLLATMAEE